MTDYDLDCWCPHCSKVTPHVCRDSHERDSSSDYQRCLVCDWYSYGTSGRYYPPTAQGPAKETT